MIEKDVIKTQEVLNQQTQTQKPQEESFLSTFCDSALDAVTSTTDTVFDVFASILDACSDIDLDL